MTGDVPLRAACSAEQSQVESQPDLRVRAGPHPRLRAQAARLRTRRFPEKPPQPLLRRRLAVGEVPEGGPHDTPRWRRVDMPDGNAAQPLGASDASASRGLREVSPSRRSRRHTHDCRDSGFGRVLAAGVVALRSVVRCPGIILPRSSLRRCERVARGQHLGDGNRRWRL